jgi:aryl-alcohol dehydrogenase-like predicted oxidoreductase
VHRRQLGSLAAPAVGFGAMVLSPGLYGPVDRDDAVRALLHAIDAGSYFIDTSDGYGSDAHNERLIGASIAGRRDDVVISTKFGYRVPPGVERHPFQVSYGTLAVNAEPQHVRGYALASVERLRTDHIDLYSPHFPDPVVPIEETVGAIAELVSEGLVRHIGLSNVSAEQLQRAVAVHEISAVQCEWSLWTTPDPALLAVADRHCVGLVAWSPGSSPARSPCSAPATSATTCPGWPAPTSPRTTTASRRSPRWPPSWR